MQAWDKAGISLHRQFRVFLMRVVLQWRENKSIVFQKYAVLSQCSMEQVQQVGCRWVWRVWREGV